jgi:putative aminopeptidase FrvX
MIVTDLFSEVRMRVRIPKTVVLMSAVLLAAAALTSAADIKILIKDFHSTPAATGNEDLLAAKIAALLPKPFITERDNLGSLYGRLGGSSAGGTAVLAPLDEFGHVVSGMTADGYLRLDRAAALPSPVFDSFLMGHPVVLSTRKGLRHGIVVQPAMHVLSRELRDTIANAFSLDLVYVDIGVRSEAEARERGIEILDAVTLWPELSTLAADRWAGPNLGQKSLCAVLASAAGTVGAASKPPAATFVWMAQTKLIARGTRGSLGATRARNKLTPKYAVALDVAPAERDEKSPALGKGPVLVLLKDVPSPLRTAIESAAARMNITLQVKIQPPAPLLAPFGAEGTDGIGLALPVKFAGTPSEVVDLKDVQALTDLLANLLLSGSLK